jgi:hypothetical protein
MTIGHIFMILIGKHVVRTIVTAGVMIYPIRVKTLEIINDTGIVW